MNRSGGGVVVVVVLVQNHYVSNPNLIDGELGSVDVGVWQFQTSKIF